MESSHHLHSHPTSSTLIATTLIKLEVEMAERSKSFIFFISPSQGGTTSSWMKSRRISKRVLVPWGYSNGVRLSYLHSEDGAYLLREVLGRGR
ncbi:hypothetical protein AVEN_192014-1 [Araneus ventricosus]|uniref:Uncharacterized protein n=1 Tax=Araneus ventricosus TaxID=182803 RepID=A0A4Y2B746_ARAVE|nr:hypothetical protein AVEN_192014-1 [Araneus ventricosus]